MRMPSIKYQKLVKTSTRNRGRRRCMKSTIADGKLSMGFPPPQCVTHKDGQVQRGEQAPFAAAYFTHESRELKLSLSLGENTSGAGHTGHSNHLTSACSYCLQRALRSRFRQQLTPSVDMICIATACAKRPSFWRKLCPNHQTFCFAPRANHTVSE